MLGNSLSTHMLVGRKKCGCVVMAAVLKPRSMDSLFTDYEHDPDITLEIEPRESVLLMKCHCPHKSEGTVDADKKFLVDSAAYIELLEFIGELAAFNSYAKNNPKEFAKKAANHIFNEMLGIDTSLIQVE